MNSGHILFVGFMGAGKSTVARSVAASLGLPYVDLDSSIEERAGMTAAEIFSRAGEDGFRDLESEALADLIERPPLVIACGGGVILRAENRAALKRMGTVVYLQVTAAEAIARVGDASTRPLLAGPAGALAATSLLTAREALYRAVADIVVETVGRSADEVADAVLERLGAGS